MTFIDGEDILPDNYPLYCGYIYIFDGKIQYSDIECSVGEFKRISGVFEIRRCEIVKRKIV